MSAVALPASTADAPGLTPAGRNIEAHAGGGTPTQIANGDNNTLVWADHGSIVNVLQGPLQIDRRPIPVLLPPLPFPGLLGRATEVAAAKATLATAQPFEFYAEPGWGKTALLRYLGPIAAGSFPDGMVYEPSAGQPLGDLLQFVFDAFYRTNVPFKPTDGQLRHYLNPIRALLLLDDLALQRDEIDALMTCLPGCVLLVASRERTLWGIGQVKPVGGLPKEAAVELFERELGRLLAPAEQPAFDQLWSSVAGNPLSLIEAAALERDKRRGLANLTVGPPTSENVTAELVASSNEDQRTALGLLSSVYDASLPVSHVAAITGIADAADVLAQLSAKGLVERNAGGYRLKREPSPALPPAGTGEEWTERAIKHFSAWANEFAGHAAVILGVSDALLKILDLATETQRHWFEVVQLVRSLDKSLGLSGRWAAWERVLNRGLQAAHALGDQALEAWALHQLGSRALCLGDLAAAQTFLKQALQIRQSLGDAEGARVTQHNLDRIHGGTPPDSDGGHKPDTTHTPRPSPRPIIVKAIGIVAGVTLAAVLGLKIVPALMAGQLSVEPSAQVDVGAVSVGKTARAQIRIHNVGRGDLVLVQIPAGSGDFSQTNDCPMAPQKLRPDEACTIQIRFTPTHAGSITSQLQVIEQGGDVHQIQLTGTGAAALVKLPSVLDFGSQAAGVPSAAKEVSLRNTGNDALTNLRITPSGDFQIGSSDCPQSLPAGKACLIDIVMTPAVLGPRSGTLTVTDGLGTQTVALRGVGILAFTLTPSPADFGSVAVGGRAVRTIILTNTSGIPLALNQITTSTKDFIPATACRQEVLPPQSTCPIAVAFNPTTTGPRTDKLAVVARSGDEQDDALSGIGLAPLALDIVPPAVDFKDQSMSTIVNVSNRLTTAVSLGQVTFKADSTELGLPSDSCSNITLAPGGLCRMLVQYRRNVDLVSSHPNVCGQLTFVDNDVSSPQVVKVTGRGSC